MPISTAITILPGIVLWPWGIIPVLYLAIRLHLNKLIVIATLALVMLPIVPKLCMIVGRELLQTDRSPHLEWIVGSHIIALPLSLLSALLIYLTAKALFR